MPSAKQKLSKTQKLIRDNNIKNIVSISLEDNIKDTKVFKAQVKDGYHSIWYKAERLATRFVGKSMEAYLAKRASMSFDHSSNKAKKMLYMLPAFREWSTLMPGALALEPIHDPDRKVLPNGKPMDPLTSRIFRHSRDTVGVRSRTLTGGYIAAEYAIGDTTRPLIWLSLAGGTAAPSMLMVNSCDIPRERLHYVNIDSDPWAISIAKEVAALEGLTPHNTELVVGDIFNTKVLHDVVAPSTADIIDLMGIFEYLDAAHSQTLLKNAYDLLRVGGVIIACNMRSDHPELNLHKRGVGWPRVIQRSVEELVDLCERSSISSSQLTVYQPEDGVYNIMRIVKS